MMNKWIVLVIAIGCAACQSSKDPQKKDLAQRISEIPLTGSMTAEVRNQESNIEKIAQKSVKKSEEITGRYNEEMKNAQEQE